MKRICTDLEIELELWKQGIMKVAGVDEAGRGPLAGPVVAAAVIFPEGLMIDGVNDSKKLSAVRREELFARISEEAINIGIGIVDHKTIDRINILKASVLAMHYALENLSVKPDFVIADGNSFRDDRLPYRNIIAGDAKSFTIAAASIIAKVTRDRLMGKLDQEFPQYGFAQHKGYGTRRHLEAIRLYGLCEVHRRSFRPAVFSEKIPFLSGK
jgi:ribonuclease HII